VHEKIEHAEEASDSHWTVVELATCKTCSAPSKPANSVQAFLATSEAEMPETQKTSLSGWGIAQVRIQPRVLFRF